MAIAAINRTVTTEVVVKGFIGYWDIGEDNLGGLFTSQWGGEHLQQTWEKTADLFRVPATVAGRILLLLRYPMKRKASAEASEPDTGTTKTSSTTSILLESAIRDMAQKLTIDKTFWPSVIPRGLEKLGKLRNWREYMQPTREVAFEMYEKGELDILAKGERLSLTSITDIRGPIRLRRSKAKAELVSAKQQKLSWGRIGV